MSILVGFTLKDSGAHAHELAAMLARTTHQDVVVGVVVAGTWPPSPERLDSEYRAYLTQRAEQGIFQARAWMPSDVKTSFVLTEAASVPEGLLGLAREHKASVLVLGSSEAGIGYVSLGGVADRLVHTSDVPVAFAPRGFLPEPGGRVRRVTAAFSGTRKDRDLVRCVATYAAQYDVSLRVASFSVRPKKTPEGSGRPAALG
jgi:nucleotide-binding universal stress UspA family protein